MSEQRKRVVTDSMIGLEMPDIDRWSERVTVVLGQNPGPFTGPGTNTYIVGSGARRIVLDPGQGHPAYPALLEKALEEASQDSKLPVSPERIVITHAHPDHIGGVEDVCSRFGALPILKRPWPENDRGLPVQAIDEGDVVRVEGATLRALWTPGHARDHLCFYLEEERALFSGDMVLGAGTTVIPRDGDLGDYLAGLRRLLDLDLALIYPAHGPRIRDPKAKIRAYLDHRALRDEQILQGLSSGPAEVSALVEGIYTDVPAFLHAAAGVSVEAHLRRFESLGRVRRDGERWMLL